MMKGIHMAERVTRQVVDDIDGTDITDGGGETIEFSVRGVSYRIDLSTRNVSKFDKTLTPYINAALEVSGRERPRNRRAKKSRSTKAKAGTSPSAIRAWAAENGYTVSPRGRVPREVLEAFEGATAR
jgi:hypothetical protein